MKLFFVEILCEAQSFTLNLPLIDGCRDVLFKAYLLAIKRMHLAANADWKKETLIKKLRLTFALTL